MDLQNYREIVHVVKIRIFFKKRTFKSRHIYYLIAHSFMSIHESFFMCQTYSILWS